MIYAEKSWWDDLSDTVDELLHSFEWSGGEVEGALAVLEVIVIIL